MAIFEYQYANKYKTIDDTHKIQCSIETSQEVNGHTEYLLRLERNLNNKKSWVILRRYRDFSALNKCLRESGIDLPLPGKRLIGNMRTEFVAERRRALQIFMNTILMNPILASSLPAKRFVDPDNYAQSFHDNAVQNASLCLRNDGLWTLGTSLGAIGWRLRKHYFHVLPKTNDKNHGKLRKSSSQQSKHSHATNNVESQHAALQLQKEATNSELVLEWLEYGPDKYIEEKEINGILRSLIEMQHPNIDSPIYSSHNEHGCLVIRKFYSQGSLKDILCNSIPKNSFLSKYGNPKKRASLTYKQVANYGVQILDALIFLKSKGFPYGHLHSGNIVIHNDSVKLLDVENYILGVPSFYRPYFMQHSKIHSIESLDVYSFGHVIFEMTMGHPLQESIVRGVHDCPELLTKLLESILTKEACRAGLPTLEQLREHEFFVKNVTQSPVIEASLKLSVNAKEIIRQSVLKTEHRLREEQKLVKNQKRIVRVQEMMSCEEERRKSKQKAKTEQKFKMKQQTSLQKGNGSIETATSSAVTMTRTDSIMTPQQGTGISTRPSLSPTNKTSIPPLGQQQDIKGHNNHDRLTKQNALGSIDRQSSSAYTSSEDPNEPTRSALLESITRFNRSSLRKVRSNENS